MATREPRLLIDALFNVFTAAEANEFRNIPGRTTDFYFHESNGEYIEVGWYEGADWQPTMKWLFAAIEGPGIPGFYEKVTFVKG